MISIIIPAYNEEKMIVSTLKKVDGYFRKRNDRYEIIVVDDCSKDNTVKLAEGYIKKTHNKNIMLLKNVVNRGKGYSVKKGMLKAKYDLVLFSDCDLATPIEETEKLLKYAKDYDIVIASRNVKGSIIKVKQPWYRRMAGKIFPFFVRFIAVHGIKDTQCGFKMFKKSVVKKIFPLQTFERWCFDVELLFIARKKNYTIKEVPVVWINRAESKVNLIKDSSRMLADLFKIRYNSLIGKYKK